MDSLGSQALCQLQGFKRQFWELKRTHMDVVLFVQVGNFYNLLVSPTPCPLRGVAFPRGGFAVTWGILTI